MTKIRAADPEQVKKNNAALKKGSGIAIAAMIAATLVNEGGYVFHKADPGGETNLGITKQVAVNAGYTAPMKQLPKEVATSIYYQQYVVDTGYDKLVDSNAPVVSELYDTTVNMGPTRPMRFLQRSLNQVCNTTLPVTGKMSLDVQISFQNCSDSLGPVKFCLQMLDALDAQQRAEYDRLVRMNPKLRVFYKGWTTHRINNVPRSSCKVTYAGL
jgi:hypothetical protein